MTRASLLVLLTPLLLCGCPDGGGKTCGAPFDGGASGVQAAAGGTTFVYGGFTSTHAGDCGRESITIDATQIAPTPAPFHLVLCVARADHIGSDPIPLAGAAGDGMVEVVDVNGQTADCQLALDFTAAPDGTATFAGYCDAGGTSYNLTLAGTAPGILTCSGTPAPTTITLSGAATILGQ